MSAPAKATPGAWRVSRFEGSAHSDLRAGVYLLRTWTDGFVESFADAAGRVRRFEDENAAAAKCAKLNAGVK